VQQEIVEIAPRFFRPHGTGLAVFFDRRHRDGIVAGPQSEVGQKVAKNCARSIRQPARAGPTARLTSTEGTVTIAG
jgi:hypothetical protein